MSEEKKAEKSKVPRTVESFKAEQAADKSWKKEPWIGEDGFEYRAQRVKNSDGTHTVFNVRVGANPILRGK